MKKYLKSQIKRKFPYFVSAYHEYRNKQHYRDFKIKRSPFGFDFIGAPAMQNGTFEPEETQVIISELKKCDVFVDVGANVGYFVCLARNLDKKTVAIEPLSDNLNYLLENLHINDWRDVEVYPMGVASSPGFADLFGGSTAASLLSGWAGSSELWKRTIALSTLDILIGNRFDEKQLMIKVDVEGAELEVIKGSTNTLKMNPSPVWLMEICLTEHYPQGINPNFKAVFDAFWGHGYSAYSVEANERIVTSEDVDRWLRQGYRDFGYVSFLFKK